jgi:hypothetical protein
MRNLAQNQAEQRARNNEFLIRLTDPQKEAALILRAVQRVGAHASDDYGISAMVAQTFENYLRDVFPSMFGITYGEFCARRARGIRVPLESMGMAAEILGVVDGEEKEASASGIPAEISRGVCEKIDGKTQGGYPSGVADHWAVSTLGGLPVLCSDQCEGAQA